MRGQMSHNFEFEFRGKKKNRNPRAIIFCTLFSYICRDNLKRTEEERLDSSGSG
jgi:hypothetical protein